MKAFDPTAMAGLIRVRWLRQIRRQWFEADQMKAFDPTAMAGFDQKSGRYIRRLGGLSADQMKAIRLRCWV